MSRKDFFMNNCFFENIKKDTTKRLKIIELQKKFESGLILENDLSNEEKIELERLYDEQIQELDMKIARKENELKRKIILNNKYFAKAIEKKSKKV